MEIIYILHCSSENDNFVELCHLSKEFVAAWSHIEPALVPDLIVMDQSFIQIQHESIRVWVIKLW